MRSLYLECNAGISGDMLVAALLDLGADRIALDKALKSIKAGGFTYSISRVQKSGINCCDFAVHLDVLHENHDHDMDYLYGTSTHEHFHAHCDKASDNNEYIYKHTHQHRGIKEIEAIINEVEMTENARILALKIFDILAAAESKAHAIHKEKVHFHEVGAIDSIVDIVSIAVCIDSLKFDRVVVPSLSEGQGSIRCQHGILPVPVPAVANILQTYGIKVHVLPAEGEFVTPTGAAAVAAIRTDDVLPVEFKILSIGLGAGKRQYSIPSILRIMIIEDEDYENKDKHADYVCQLETDIDDCTGQILSYTLERLFAAGALDVHFMPIYMKKNRPAWKLEVICRQEDVPTLEDIIFAETTTIGIRRIVMARTILSRHQTILQTKYGPLTTKLCGRLGKEKLYVEYESAAAIARKYGIPLSAVYASVLKDSE